MLIIEGLTQSFKGVNINHFKETKGHAAGISRCQLSSRISISAGELFSASVLWWRAKQVS